MDIKAPLPEGAELIDEPIDNAAESRYRLQLTEEKINVHLVSYNKTVIWDEKTTKVKAVLIEPILSMNPIFADFFDVNLFITGNGSGIVITPQKEYSGGECLEISCEESYAVITDDTDFDMVETSPELDQPSKDCSENACKKDYLVKDTITITVTPNVDSILTKSDCVEKPQVIKGGFYYSVADCTIKFDSEYSQPSSQFDFEYPQLSSHAIDTDGNLTETMAIFVGGISTENNSPQKEVVYDLFTEVNIRGIITVPSEHLEQADILVVAKHTPFKNEQTTFFMRKGDSVAIWDENIAHLAAFQENISLAKTQHVEIYSGKLPKGRWEIYFGYRLQNGTIIFNDEPLKVQVNPPTTF